MAKGSSGGKRGGSAGGGGETGENELNLKPANQSLLDEYNQAKKDSIRNKLIDDNADKLNDLWDERNRLVDLSNKSRITNGKLSSLAAEKSKDIDELFINAQGDLSNSIKMRRIAGTVNATESGRVELKGGKTFENKEKLKERGYKWTGDSWGKNTGSLPDSIQELRFIRDKF